jgi:hypothetical protein
MIIRNAIFICALFTLSASLPATAEAAKDETPTTEAAANTAATVTSQKQPAHSPAKKAGGSDEDC